MMISEMCFNTDAVVVVVADETGPCWRMTRSPAWKPWSSGTSRDSTRSRKDWKNLTIPSWASCSAAAGSILTAPPPSTSPNRFLLIGHPLSSVDSRVDCTPADDVSHWPIAIRFTQPVSVLVDLFQTVVEWMGVPSAGHGPHRFTALHRSLSSTRRLQNDLMGILFICFFCFSYWIRLYMCIFRHLLLLLLLLLLLWLLLFVGSGR